MPADAAQSSRTGPPVLVLGQARTDVVIGGLGLASVLTLFVTAVLYDLLARFTRPTSAIEQELEAALAARSAPAE